MNRLIIIGASGHGKVVADIARLVGYEEIVFLDNNYAIKKCVGYPVMGPDTMTKELEGDIFVAIGNSGFRKKLMDRDSDRMFPTLIHPDAVIAKGSVVGEGSVIMAGVVINPDVKVGKSAIINTSSSVDHDCIIGDYCHISVGTHLSGAVCVGDNCWIGAGAIVSNNVNVCSDVIIGAGAVVIKDIQEEGTYIGVPAKKMLKSKASAVKQGECTKTKNQILKVESVSDNLGGGYYVDSDVLLFQVRTEWRAA